MSVISQASNYFPNVSWDGQSPIHVSVCKDVLLPYDAKSWKRCLATVAKGNFGPQIYKNLTQRFSGMEWIIGPDDFTTLFLADCYRHLNGMPDSESDSKLTNPYTGNRFHRIALIGNLVGGIRFWCDPYSESTNLGYRFRIEAQNEEEEDTRVRAREIVEEANEMIEMVMDSFMEVAEPSTQELEKVKAFELQKY